MKTNIIRHIPLLLLGLLFALPLHAQQAGTIEEGMKAYSDADYAEAVRIFEGAIETSDNPSDELFYNLGASYYKQGEYALALLNFRRAYRLDPTDRDIRHNIEMTRSKTIDAMEPQPTFFIARWIDGITHLMGLGGWMFVALIFFTIFVGGILLYLLTRSRDMRLLGFYGSIAGLLLCIVANIMVYRSHGFIHDTSEAVITAPVVTVKSSPDLSSEDVMVVHSGMEVKVLRQLSGLSEVQFPDGSKGWIEDGAYETVNNF